jgi:hypothetical protein
MNNMITNASPPAKVTVPPLLKMREVSKLLSLSRGSVQALIESGDLEAQPLNFYQKRFGHPLQRALQSPFAN